MIIPSYIEAFVDAVYPGAGRLALASFSEEKTLRDATEELTQLRAVALAARALARSVQPGLSPDTEIVSEPALTRLETALAAAGYDSPEGEPPSPPQEGHKPSCFVYRYARALIGADRRGMCDCGFEASQRPKP